MKKKQIDNYLENNLKSNNNDITDNNDRLVWLSDVKKVVNELINTHFNKTEVKFELVSENLTNLGGRMGTEYTYDNWRKPFTNVEDAKKYAEQDYKKKITWRKTEKGFRSDDLGYVMYYINKLKPVK